MDNCVAAQAPRAETDPLLMTALRVLTFDGQMPMTNASGFFFEREGRLYLVTSRHVLYDEPSSHFPNRIEIELHTDRRNLVASTGFSMLLYEDGQAVWHQADDSGGPVDIAVMAIERDALPETALVTSFTPAHLLAPGTPIEIGSTLQVIGFPLGFHDTLHHLPVSRQAAVASAYGLRFQGLGYFLTDARTHRGTSGAPVVMRAAADTPSLGTLPWHLLGVHSSRMDIGTRDIAVDEALGLNCTWYADILMPLTEN